MLLKTEGKEVTCRKRRVMDSLKFIPRWGYNMTDKFYIWEEQKNSFRLETKKSLHGLFKAGLRFNPGLILNLYSVLNVYKSKFL